MAFFRFSKKSDRFPQQFVNEKTSPKRKRKAIRGLKQSMDRQSKVETLERRELLAAEILADFEPEVHAVFAPGTSQDYIDQWNEANGHDDDHDSLDNGINVGGARWTNPTGGPSPDVGDGATVSWSIVPDGTVSSAARHRPTAI